MKSDKTSTHSKKITRNYNNEPLKPGEVLVPTMYDAAFAKAHCTNPDCMGWFLLYPPHSLPKNSTPIVMASGIGTHGTRKILLYYSFH